ncbi:MAG TPA: Hsp70 family protein [Blastocatellia bacterium]|nr:Hsp70 family protein [Blastocatellia bacterium]HMX26522.1 Hsp70 family protein [Blastocatellia bacterium]HNG32048.1 Hsp70 family protein [Blastocatellia bacterium]
MLLGIDFGTTRTVVAAVDRGNYPVISFQPEDGDTLEWYPSVAAAREEEIVFGFDALQKQGDDEWQMLRSFKRLLAAIGPEERIELGELRLTALELLTSFLSALRRDLLARSNLRLKRGKELEAMISVPANANSNQRFLTLEAFRRAGFAVRGMLNEPSAAGIEYAHLLSTTGTAKRETLVVYDLGGGTFDSSVINLVERDHEVLSSEGIAKLGGDNFDIILLDLAMKAADLHELPDAALLRLLEECRHKKESLHPNTRRITIDLGLGVEGAGEVTIPVSDFYEECRPLIESTIEAMEQVMEKSAREAGFDLHETAAVYLVGGSSDLPLVARLLREKYGRQVRRSPYPHAATAIGLAIAADTDAGYKLRERFTRHFGVWRELEGGKEVFFDALFEKDTPLPATDEPPLTRVRRYVPTHNLGDFRYLECSRVSETGQPQGDLAPWDEIVFPFDSALQTGNGLKEAPIVRGNGFGNPVKEVYSCDANGIIEVEITDTVSGFSRRYKLRGQ